MSDELAIRLRGVVKRYGTITAVDHLDLDVPVGTCVGLLGPNGAGKSTTMRILTAQSIADEGEIDVLGFRLPRESKPARAECGVVPQLDNLDTTLTVQQNLLVFTHLYRIGRADRAEAIERALKMANLVDRRDTRVDKLSGGMRRRLLIARALVHRPRLVLMDEPTVGLDPQVRQELWALIDALRSEGTTILMSTHYIEEAQRLADTVLIMSHGSAVAAGSPVGAREQARGQRGARGLRRRRRGWPRSSRRRAPPGCGRGAPARAWPCSASTRTASIRSRASAARRTSKTSSSCSPARRSTDGCDRAAADRPARAARPDRRPRARDRQLLVLLALDDVLVDRRADDLLSRVRLRVRLARGDDRRPPATLDFIATGTVATAVLFSAAFPAMFGTFVKYQFQRTYDAILAAPVDTEELVTAETLWIATRAGLYGCVPLIVAIPFGLDPSWGMLFVPVIAWTRGPGLGRLRDHGRRFREVVRELQLHRERGADAALPRRGDVLSAERAARVGPGARPSSTPCTSASSSCAISSSWK